jgi:membrane protease YdiL (CAAX protease family)
MIARMTRLMTNDRVRSAVELATVLVLTEIWLWTSPSALLYRALAGGVIVFIVARNIFRTYPEDRKAGQPLWGGRESWIATLAITCVLGAGAILLAYGLYAEGEQWRLGRLERILEPRVFAEKVFIVVLQQLILCRFLFPLFRRVVGNRKAALAVTAIAFGLLHLPSLFLALMAAAVAVMWLFLFERSRRLVPLMVSHLVLVIIAAALFPERLAYNLAVGRNALPIARYYERVAEGTLAGRYDEWKSDAYYEKHGHSDRTYIIALYRDVLRRGVSESEIDAWLLKLHDTNRAEAIVRFINSKEYLELRCRMENACDKLPTRIAP